jgi:Protein of unknown function (DUF3108)
MRQSVIILIGLLLPSAALAQAPLAVHASYATYAAGLEIADVDASVSMGPRDYRMNLAYHTTGMAGFLFSGHQYDEVQGNWHGIRPVPDHFVGQGTWHGTDRLTEIAYEHGQPKVRQLLPADDDPREPVPDTLQSNSIDVLSALMKLIRAVGSTGRCDATVRTYDGRRAVEIEAHTVGQEELGPSRRSNFSGNALRCSFSGRMVAGFKLDGNRAREAKPLHGSAWLAPVVAGGPPIPVRMSFETRWFGDATMELTGVRTGQDAAVARGSG